MAAKVVFKRAAPSNTLVVQEWPVEEGGGITISMRVAGGPCIKLCDVTDQGIFMKEHADAGYIRGMGIPLEGGLFRIHNSELRVPGR